MNRWAIWIDIEGFSLRFLRDDALALVPLGALLEGTYLIGSRAYPESPNRLFAHQTGDGAVIVSECAEGWPHVPIAIACALLRTVLVSGGAAKAGVAQGQFADVQGCYPQAIRDAMDSDGTIRMGRGLLRIFPVMGTALVHAYTLTTKLSGALLLVDGSLAGSLPEGLVVSKEEPEYVVLDWVHLQTPELEEIREKAGLSWPETAALEDRLRHYVLNTTPAPPEPWVHNTLDLTQCGPSQ